MVVSDSLSLRTVLSLYHLLGASCTIHFQPELLDDVRETKAYPEQGVYQSVQAAVNVLKNSDLVYTKEVQRLIKIYRSQLESQLTGRMANQMSRMPYITIEGDEASGKEQLCRRLAHVLYGMYIYSPPPFLSKERDFFDKQPDLLKSAFYALSNYIVAQKIKEESLIRPTVTTRGWHHSTTFSLAQQYVRNATSLPPPDSDLYRWPEDLLMPDIVFYLAFSYKERAFTRTFRQAIEAAYSRMKTPYVITIGYCNTNSDVFEKVLTELNRTCGSMLYDRLGRLKHLI